MVALETLALRVVKMPAVQIFTLHSALLISDLGIYCSNLRGTYIEQVSPGEPEKKTSGNGTLIDNSESPLSCADAFVTRVCAENPRTC